MKRPASSTAIALASVAAVVVCLVVMPRSGFMRMAYASAVLEAVGVVALISAIAISARAYRHARFSRQLLQLSSAATLSGTTVRELSSIEGAFVVGLLRPRIYCSTDLTTRLTAAELRAVLLHERFHQLDRAPAKLVVLETFAPALRQLRAGRAWLAQRLATLEVAADRYAIRHGASRAALARALLKMAPRNGLTLGIGFASAAELRLQALLDPAAEPEPRVTAGIGNLLPVAIAVGCTLLVLLR